MWLLFGNRGCHFFLLISLCLVKDRLISPKSLLRIYMYVFRIPPCTICALDRVRTAIMTFPEIGEVYNDAMGLRRLRACLMLACFCGSMANQV